jgi:polysaccharide biosynthesis/export protein
VRHGFWIISAAASIALSGCAHKPPLVGGASVKVTDAGSLPPPTRADLSSNSRPYVLGPFDKIEIDVFDVKELSRSVQADASGRIAVPLIGVVEAAGLSPGELADVIAAKLRGRFVRNPQVSVNLIETVSQVVTVDGEVKEPGLYPVIGRMTLMRAVATAKGSTEFAKLSRVVVFRQVDGQHLAALYDLKSIRRGALADPEIFANDVIVVGNSEARRLFKDFLQIVPLITTPIVTIIATRSRN